MLLLQVGPRSTGHMLLLDLSMALSVAFTFFDASVPCCRVLAIETPASQCSSLLVVESVTSYCGRLEQAA